MQLCVQNTTLYWFKYLNRPKPVIQQSFQDGYITEGKGWMRMHNSRNLTSHTYDQTTAKEVIESIRYEYYFLLNSLQEKLNEEIKRELKDE